MLRERGAYKSSIPFSISSCSAIIHAAVARPKIQAKRIIKSDLNGKKRKKAERKNLASDAGLAVHWA